MNFMARERDLLATMVPELVEKLMTTPLVALEQPGSPAIAWFKESACPGLLIPTDCGGCGLSPVEAIRAQRAIGALSPSLGVATTMHHFSVASLITAAKSTPGLGGLLLESIARDRLLVASGFAEGQASRSILLPTLTVARRQGRLCINGSKKPCSLSKSMDLLTVSVASSDEHSPNGLSVALVPRSAAGLSIRPFWKSPVLAAAESDEVVLTDVEIVPELMVATRIDDGRLDTLQLIGFGWFELLLSATYIGVASALAERALRSGRAGADVVCGLEAAMSGLEGAAADLSTVLSQTATIAPPDRSSFDPRIGDAMLTRVLSCRYAAQDAIESSVARALEALGGVAFATSEDQVYLAGAASALKFHPPTRRAMGSSLVASYTDGSGLRVA